VLTAALEAPPTPLPAPRVNRKRADNEPPFEIRTPLHHLTGGVDLTQIDGIAPYTALKLIAEIGTDMRRWPTEKHFTSWLTLAPKNNASGGRLLSSRTVRSANRAAVILRIAAMTRGKALTWRGSVSLGLVGLSLRDPTSRRLGLDHRIDRARWHSSG
jgi:transposase